MKCNNKLDFSLLRIYKPIDALIKECLVPCRYCNELHSTFMLKSHESSCPKTPLSELVSEMMPELVAHSISGRQLTEQDLNDFYIQKNLMHSFNQMVNKYSESPVGTGDGEFITHVISDTDTLSGIALRYGVSVNDLRKANRLVGNGDTAMYKLVVLRVPVVAQPVQAQEGGMDAAAYNLLKRRTIARFARKSGCLNLDEAKYYLETYHFDFDKALVEYQTDAKVALPIPPATISVAHVPSTVTPKPTKPNRSCCFF